MLDFILFLMLMMLVLLAFILVSFGDIRRKLKKDSDFAGGRGTPTRPYLIKDVGQLDRVRDHPESHFRLISSIDLKRYCRLREFSGGWQPLGSEEEKFSGTFDGQNYTIKNIYIERPEGRLLGLFGCTDESALIKDLNLEGCRIEGSSQVGGLAGKNCGIITGCCCQGDVLAEKESGGLVGLNSGKIIDCEFLPASSEGSVQEMIGLEIEKC